MRFAALFAVMALMISAVAAPAEADNSGRIYGKIVTVDGDEFEGLIRWDKNEGSWVDFLNGNKELDRKHTTRYKRRYRDRKRPIKIFGINIGYSTSYSRDYGAAQSGVRFGHLRMLEVIDDDAVVLTFKTGETVELEGGSTDIGEGIREIVIEDKDEGEIEFGWGDIDRIEFKQGAADLPSSFGDPLYGTVHTRHGGEFVGWICWDIDEIFTADILDGEEGGRSRKIKFGKIKAIERRGSNSCTVYLTNGDDLRLKGTNDVDSSNRGIVITDAQLGQVVVQWDDFDRVEFTEPSKVLRYDDFNGGVPIEGTVFTDDGEEYTGRIRWDDDEEYTWEVLDGNYRDIEFDIEFGNIREIKKKSYDSSLVTLWDGRSFRLEDSNDVNDSNKGIFITTVEGEETEIDWDEFDRIEFKKR